MCLTAPLTMLKVDRPISDLLMLYLARWDVLPQKKLLLVSFMLFMLQSTEVCQTLVEENILQVESDRLK